MDLTPPPSGPPTALGRAMKALSEGRGRSREEKGKLSGNRERTMKLPGAGSLDIYNNFEWSVTKANNKEDLKLSSTGEKRAVLDLALVMDCTASMGPWIQHSKNTLSKVIDNIKKSASNSKEEQVVRVAFVGFRDFVDGNKIFSVHDFTSDIGAIKRFISSQQAIGGGDEPEDVIGAMHQVLQLSWYPDSVRLVTIIADAPTHGRKYYTREMWDDYPEGSPAGLVLEDMVRKFIDEKLDLTLYKLTNDTEVMYNIIKDVGNEWVDFVDIRQDIRASRDSGLGDYSDSVGAAYATKSSSVLAYRAMTYSSRSDSGY